MCTLQTRNVRLKNSFTYSHTEVTKLQFKNSVCPFPTKRKTEMSKVRSASLTIFPLTKLNHFFLALSASFHIAHKVAAFLQPHSRQQLQLEESADLARSRNQGTTNTKHIKRGKAPKL